MSLSEDESVQVMTSRLKHNLPFFYLRYGDGALECIHRMGRGFTCDGEQYSSELGKALQDAWTMALRNPNLFIGDWRTTYLDSKRTGEYPREYAALLNQSNHTLNFLHFEALNLRESSSLMSFLSTVKTSTRRKLYMGPSANSGVTAMLGTSHLATSMNDLFGHIDSLMEQLEGSHFDILLFGAGMAGAIAAIRCADKFPDRTYIHVGAAFDPLFRGRSRTRQLSTRQARAIFESLL